MQHPLFKLFRWAVFKVGDTRRISSFPWITWDVSEHKITLDEVLRDAMPKLEPGDVIVHRDSGFLGNLFIGGAMIHAGLYVGDGYVVEALSEDVAKRSAAYILHSDYAMILRPRLSEQDKKYAIGWANRFVGYPYDPLFNFNAKEERDLVFLSPESEKIAFACTEIPMVSYLDHIDTLGINLRKNINFLTRILSWVGLNAGQRVIDADMYVKAVGFDLVWASKCVTMDWADRMKVGSLFKAKLERYLRKKIQDA